MSAASSSRPTTAAEEDSSSLTFNPPEEEKACNENSVTNMMTRNTIVEKKNWKDRYYSDLADQELELIVWKAESIDDSYEFSDGKTRPYKPISNLLWKGMTRKKRELQDMQSKINPTTDIKAISEMEDMLDAYYAKMCEIYFEMRREEYDNLPPAETMLAVKAANHKTIHPLKIGKGQGQNNNRNSKK